MVTHGTHAQLGKVTDRSEGNPATLRGAAVPTRTGHVATGVSQPAKGRSCPRCSNLKVTGNRERSP